MYLVITVLMIGMLSGAELDIFIPSFPEIQAQFNLSPFMTQLTLSLNFIAYCICSLLAGAISDKYDRRKVIIISLLIFIFGSILCSLAQNYSTLLLGRVLQGFGIAGPSVLGYVIIADEYPTEKQVYFIGLMHGLIAFAMSAAPVFGSQITWHFGWRGNFVSLLIFALICLILSAIFIPAKATKSQVTLSLKAYLPLLKSKKLILFTAALCLFMVPYWVFIGISPILYRKDLGVSLEEFGFYQGTLAAIFAIGSALSSLLMRRIGLKKAFFIGISMCSIHVISLCFLMIFGVKNPLIITFCMAIASAGVAIPINMLYPYALEVLEDTKGMASAFISGVRLIISSVGLWLVGSTYNGTFVPVGLWIVITMSLAIILSTALVKREAIFPS
ncbi:MAG: MFS transporter [Candidatus Midichloria sp.]|nr:MAG: MFS transporter [Candidatus Midichloria sp.]